MFSYGTVAQGLPHKHETNNKHVEPPRLKPPWSCDAPQDNIQLVLSLCVAAAAVTVGNGRWRGGVSDVVAALKTEVCR